MANNGAIKLQGRVFLRFGICTRSGLHIGGSDMGIEVGGVDKTVVRDPLTNQPYIPGSSLKGKMRSLSEKYLGLKQNQSIAKGFIHSCGAEYRDDELKTRGREEYLACDLCQVFGVPGERPFSSPTRLIVRDVHLDKCSAEKLRAARTDLPYTELKTEVSIDRITSAANPRQIERVPAGVTFSPAELIYSVFSGEDCDPAKDIDRLNTVIKALQLLEDDYLGGQGSRGSGHVVLQALQIGVKDSRDYEAEPQWLSDKPFEKLPDLVAAMPDLLAQLKRRLLDA